MQNTQKRSIQKLVLSAFLIALSIVLTHILTISTPFLRFNLGGLPILLAGILLGPTGGFLVGALADLIGGVLAGYAINLFITLGTASIGLCMGICWRVARTATCKQRLLLGIAVGNLIGSIVINSLALHLFFGIPFSVLATRVPNTLVISIAEFYLLHALLQNKSVRALFARATNEHF